MAQEVRLGHCGDPRRVRRPRAETRVAGHALGRGRAGHGPHGESGRDGGRLARLPWKPASARGLSGPGELHLKAGWARVAWPRGLPGAIRVPSLVAKGPFQASVYLVVLWRCNLTWNNPKELKAGVPHSPTRMVVTPPPTPVPHRVSSPSVCPREALFLQLFLYHFQPVPRQVPRLRQMLSWSSEALKGIWLLSLGSPGMGA